MTTRGLHSRHSAYRGRRAASYAAALALTIILLGAGATYAFRSLYAAMAQEHARPRLEGGDRFAVTNPSVVRPPASAYERFAHDDALWRAHNAPPVDWWALEEGPYIWHKPPRQIATDSAFALTRTGRLREAADVLDEWLAHNPGDLELLLEVARLRNSLGDVGAATIRYRQALAVDRNDSVRGELASVLLAGGSYAEAADEYSALLRLQPDSDAYRVGLARALLWGERPRDAERLLAAMAAAGNRDTTIVGLLRAARAAFDPPASVAHGWVAEEPGYAPYRLAYARALVGDGRARDAAAQFDTLVASDTSVALLREAAGLHGTIGDSLGAARLLGRAVRLVPEDDSLRLQYAKALAWSGDNASAIEQYGVLISQHETASLLLARGQLYVWRGDQQRGVADLRRSVALEPSYDALVLLGDVARWEGRFAESRSLYRRALALAPNDARVAGALADLRRIERLYVASIGSAEEGWTTTGTYAEDNLGFLFLAGGMSGGLAVDDETIVGIGFEQRRVAQRSGHGPDRHIDGFAVDARARRQFGSHLAVSAFGGIARHALVKDIGFGGVGVDWTAGRVSGSLSVGTGPVYGSLMSLAALAPGVVSPNANGAPLVGRTTAASVSVPVGRASLTVTGERLELSDGNARNMMSAAIRVPLAANIAALYDGSVMGYARTSDLYWDPHRYTTHSIGIEVTGQPARGVTLAIRALPGIAASEEPVVAPSGAPTAFLPARRAFQLSTGGELQYHDNRWDASAGAGYGRGREGNYQSLNGTVRVRVKW